MKHILNFSNVSRPEFDALKTDTRSCWLGYMHEYEYLSQCNFRHTDDKCAKVCIRLTPPRKQGQFSGAEAETKSMKMECAVVSCREEERGAAGT